MAASLDLLPRVFTRVLEAITSLNLVCWLCLHELTFDRLIEVSSVKKVKCTFVGFNFVGSPEEKNYSLDQTFVDFFVRVLINPSINRAII